MSELIDRKAAIRATWQEPSYTDPLNVLTEVRDRINALPTIPAPRWHRVEDELPKLPDKDYCHVWCVGWFEGQTRSVPMEYGRILKRGKREERWLLYDRISLPPTKWAYLPEPPKEEE